MKTSFMRKVVIPAMLPVLFINIYLANKFFDSGLSFISVLAVYLITTVIPCGFSMWYGWALCKEFINE